jgi:molecular chaperone DnaK (HSP70)
MTWNCHFVGGFSGRGIKRTSGGLSIIEMAFEFDENGVLKVSGEDEKASAHNGITVQSKDARLTKESREAAIERARVMREKDDFQKRASIARNNSEIHLRDIKWSLTNGRIGANPGQKKKALAIIYGALAWAEEHKREDESLYAVRERKSRMNCKGLLGGMSYELRIMADESRIMGCLSYPLASPDRPNENK